MSQNAQILEQHKYLTKLMAYDFFIQFLPASQIVLLMLSPEF